MEQKRLVIDTHTHIGVIPDMTFTGDMVIAELDRAGVDKTIGIRMIAGGGGPFGASTKHNPYNGNDYIAEVQKKYPDRIIGFCMVDFFDQNSRSFGWKPGESKLIKDNNAVLELRRCIKNLKLNGLFMHPDFQGYASNNMPFVSPVLDELVKLQDEEKRILPVLVHGVGNNIHYTVPEQIGNLAQHYTNLTFIVPQLGWALLADSMITVAKQHNNIYLELMLNINIVATKQAVREIGAQRLTLGTDAPWGSYTLGRKMIEEIASHEEREFILGGTIANLLGL
jgi:predicted TIM-barrel fold metal-dependent hydrolase